MVKRNVIATKLTKRCTQPQNRAFDVAVKGDQSDQGEESNGYDEGVQDDQGDEGNQGNLGGHLTRVMRATRVTRLRGEQGCNRVEQGAMKCDRVLRECHRV